MTSNEFKEWRSRLNLRKIGATRLLGCGQNSVHAWESGTRIPRYIALACAAIAMNVPPYGGDDRAKPDEELSPKETPASRATLRWLNQRAAQRRTR